MDREVKVREGAVRGREFYGVLKVGVQRVDVGKVRFGVLFISEGANTVIYEMFVVKGRVSAGLEGGSFCLCNTYFRKFNNQGGSHRSTLILGIEGTVEFVVTVVEAEIDKGVDSFHSQVRR